MGKLFFRNLAFLGLISLLHTAYSAAKHRSYLRLKEQENGSLPLDIILQGILSLVIAMIGIVNIAGDLKEISATKNMERKSWETMRNVPAFYMFNHRGKALSPYYDHISAN